VTEKTFLRIALIWVSIYTVLLFFLSPLSILLGSESAFEDIRNYALILSPLIAFGSVSLSLVILYLSRQDRAADQSKSIFDEFWLRTVVVPNVLKAFHGFCDMCRTHEQPMDPEDFSRQVASLRQPIAVLRGIDPNAFEDLSLVLDEVEDLGVAMVFQEDNAGRVHSEFDLLLGELITVMVDYQSRLTGE